MKYILIFAILFNFICIKGVQYCGIQRGFYIDIKPCAYKLYKPIESITKNYIQVDMNI